MKQIGTVELRDGRTAEIHLIDSPDSQAGDFLVRLLGHKRDPWMWQIREWATGAHPRPEARFYLATVDGATAGCVTSFCDGDIGLITHVYTVAEMRRLGIATVLLKQAIESFEAAAGRVLLLVSAFQSTAWQIYGSHGFVGTCPEQGYGGMVRFFHGADWESAIAGPATGVTPVSWQHFLGSLVLFGAPGPAQLRSIHLDSVGPRLIERAFVNLMHHQQNGSEDYAAAVPGAGAAVLGFGIVGRHPLWEETATRKLLDIHIHPGHSQAGNALLQELLDRCSEPVECYCDSGAEDKIALLRRFGFRQDGGSPAALRFGPSTRDLVILTRDSSAR